MIDSISHYYMNPRFFVVYGSLYVMWDQMEIRFWTLNDWLKLNGGRTVDWFAHTESTAKSSRFMLIDRESADQRSKMPENVIESGPERMWNS